MPSCPRCGEKNPDRARDLIDDPTLRRSLGAAAAEHARARFDPVRNARAVESVYVSLLGIEPRGSDGRSPGRAHRFGAGTAAEPSTA